MRVPGSYWIHHKSHHRLTLDDHIQGATHIDINWTIETKPMRRNRNRMVYFSFTDWKRGAIHGKYDVDHRWHESIQTRYMKLSTKNSKRRCLFEGELQQGHDEESDERLRLSELHKRYNMLACAHINTLLTSQAGASSGWLYVYKVSDSLQFSPVYR